MIPIGDSRIRGALTPIVTILVIVINVAVFFSYGFGDMEEVLALFRRYALHPADIMEGERLETVFTSMFMHGGLMHIIGNMLFLWVFGDNIESALGHVGFLVFYLVAGVVAALAHIYADPTSMVPTVGASGAVSGCLGSYLVMYPKARVKLLLPLGFFFYTFKANAFVFLLLWIGLQVANSALDQGGEVDGGVAWMAHIGGFVFGVVIGILFRGNAKKFVIEEEY